MRLIWWCCHAEVWWFQFIFTGDISLLQCHGFMMLQLMPFSSVREKSGVVMVHEMFWAENPFDAVTPQLFCGEGLLEWRRQRTAVLNPGLERHVLLSEKLAETESVSANFAVSNFCKMPVSSTFIRSSQKDGCVCYWSAIPCLQGMVKLFKVASFAAHHLHMSLTWWWI
jgi:hypothetical protein